MPETLATQDKVPKNSILRILVALFQTIRFFSIVPQVQLLPWSISNVSIHYLETQIPQSGAFNLTDNDTKFFQSIYETYWNRFYSTKKPTLITICFKWNLYNAYLTGYISGAYSGTKKLSTIVSFNGNVSLIEFSYSSKNGQSIRLN